MRHQCHPDTNYEWKAQKQQHYQVKRYSVLADFEKKNKKSLKVTDKTDRPDP